MGPDLSGINQQRIIAVQKIDIRTLEYINI